MKLPNFKFKQKIAGIKSKILSKKKVTQQLNVGKAPAIINSKFKQVAVLLNRRQDFKIKKILFFSITVFFVIIVTAAVAISVGLKVKHKDQPLILKSVISNPIVVEYISNANINQFSYATIIFPALVKANPTENNSHSVYEWQKKTGTAPSSGEGDLTSFNFPIWVGLGKGDSNKIPTIRRNGFGPDSSSVYAFELQLFWLPNDPNDNVLRQIDYSFGKKSDNFIENNNIAHLMQLKINDKVVPVAFIKIFDNSGYSNGNFYEQISIQAYGIHHKYLSDIKTYKIA